MPFFTHSIFKRKARREYLDDKYKPQPSKIIIYIKRFLAILLLIGISLILLVMSNPLSANTELNELSQVSMSHIREGSLLIKMQSSNNYKQLPLLHTDVNMDISGMIVRTHLKQHFKNTTKHWIEATYVFPLPESSAVDQLTMLIGERRIKGEIKEKSLAKKIYNKAKHEGKKAALVEQERPNLFTNTVTNIGPGDTIIIEIEYQQTLNYNQENFSLRFPMAITPRYVPEKPINETISLNDTHIWANLNTTARINPPINPNSTLINPIKISINLDAGFPIKNLSSSYHEITSTVKNNITHIKLANTVTASDRDFELNWSPQAGHIPKAAAFSEKVKNKNYQMLMLLPPDNGTYSGQPLARNITYIIDTSGSMHGTSIQQAKKSLLIALDKLRLHDKFNIIQFNSITDQLFNHAKVASFDNILTAKHYINNLQADGGTEMAPALELALQASTDDNYVHQIIFLTDGSVSNETELFNIINTNLGINRLFTIGIGSAPNSYFMRKAALFGRGTFTYIGDVNEVNSKMSSLFSKLESPLMTDIKVVTPKNSSIEILPKRIPDLYQGEPIILAIQSDKPLNEIHLVGTRALAPWTAKLSLPTNNSNKGVGTFWARTKIETLSDSIHDGANKDDVRNEIIDIALKHHIVSKHTSLVAVDKTPARTKTLKLNEHQLPVNLPHGQTNIKTYGQLAQTATNAQLKLFFGLGLLLLAVLITQLLYKPIPFLSFRFLK